MTWDVWKRGEDNLIEAYDNRGRKHRLNDSATMVWDTIDGKKTVQGIADFLQNKIQGNGADKETIYESVVDLLKFLLELKMISFRDSSLWKLE